MRSFPALESTRKRGQNDVQREADVGPCSADAVAMQSL